MRLRNVIEIKDFMDAVQKSKGSVWLESTQGDRFELKSTLSMYVAIAELIRDHGEELELFCASHEDAQLFFKFFSEHEDAL